MGTTPEERKALKDARRERNRQRSAEGLKALKPIGHPASDKVRIKEFKDMLLSEAVGTSVIRKVIDVARNDEHPGQMAALKMCMDRLLPTSLFEKQGNTRNAININITGLNEPNVTLDVSDAEEVDD